MRENDLLRAPFESYVHFALSRALCAEQQPKRLPLGQGSASSIRTVRFIWCIQYWFTIQRLSSEFQQVPLRSCLHQLQLPAQTIRLQIELQKEQHLQLRHSILQDTVLAAQRQMSFFPRTIPDWNGLPREIVSAESPDCFKSNLN